MGHLEASVEGEDPGENGKPFRPKQQLFYKTSLEVSRDVGGYFCGRRPPTLVASFHLRRASVDTVGGTRSGDYGGWIGWAAFGHYRALKGVRVFLLFIIRIRNKRVIQLGGF